MKAWRFFTSMVLFPRRSNPRQEAPGPICLTLRLLGILCSQSEIAWSCLSLSCLALTIHDIAFVFVCTYIIYIYANNHKVTHELFLFHSLDFSLSLSLSISLSVSLPTRLPPSNEGRVPTIPCVLWSTAPHSWLEPLPVATRSSDSGPMSREGWNVSCACGRSRAQ